MILLLAAGCSQLSPTPSPTAIPATVQPTSTPPPASPDEQIRHAFNQTDPAIRIDEVISATNAFLRSPEIQSISDEQASESFTDIAFSSGQIVFPDPAFIRRNNNLAVVGLPDGLGIYLFDLSPDSPTPVKLSEWTVGLSALNTIWGDTEFGLSYITYGNDDLARVHFMLVTNLESQWQIAWFSDDNPDWWFNAFDATLSVSITLDRLIVTGKTQNLTEPFYSDIDLPSRDFEIEWLRQEDDTYLISPPVGAYPHLQAWTWANAQPSAYTTLVEFIERLQRSDDNDLETLVTDPAVIESAISFGLNLPERRYQLTVSDEQTFILRDRQGAFTISLTPPITPGDNWQIVSILPLGAASP